MNYLFWDTERIKNTKIYMLGYILTDCDFNIRKSEILIDSSIDVSKRHSPRRKVEALRAQANILTSFDSFAKYFLDILCDEDTIGVCFGTYMGVFPGFCADRFGTKNNTVNYGIMWIGFSAAGVIGPSVLSAVRASTGAYQGAFVIAFAMAFLGLLLTVVYRRLEK